MFEDHPILVSLVLLAAVMFIFNLGDSDDSRSETHPSDQSSNYNTSYNDNSDHYEYQQKNVDKFNCGDIVTFGTYPQDGYNDPIYWVVVDKGTDALVLVSKYGLESLPFNNKAEAVTWETCDLRYWLNHDFIDLAFTDSQKNNLMYFYSSAYGNPKFPNVAQGSSVYDLVTLLTPQETEAYLLSLNEMVCRPTTHTVNNGAYLNPNTGGGWWWLRTMGQSSWDAASINSDGTIDYDDGKVQSGRGMVRPMIMVKVD